ncbi:uncharacterized protein LOC128549140 [Mercenaria mercenaria]|uniref:uncharacterized protein LOC128549140 n=1 Tax=Mercenaria mercenaria TaxID=6596 RepID=UPI00234F8A5A|nr:uncharacterized protein LOC128549140 [Mercenaria mercenaria]
MFFGVPGMATNRMFEGMFESLKTYKPRYVFINLGGNDITDSCNPHDIYLNIINIVEELYNCGVERVFVASIVERGKFPKWTGLNHKFFNVYRRSVNKKLKKYFARDFVQIGKRLIYSRYYDLDLVHPGNRQGGMKLFKHEVLKAFKKTGHC